MDSSRVVICGGGSGLASGIVKAMLLASLAARVIVLDHEGDVLRPPSGEFCIRDLEDCYAVPERTDYEMSRYCTDPAIFERLVNDPAPKPWNWSIPCFSLSLTSGRRQPHTKGVCMESFFPHQR